MRSSLTRNVYRRLLACHGLPCSVLSSRTVSRIPNRSPRLLIRHPTRRTFFNIFTKPPREVKEADPEPGYGTLLEFAQRSAEGLKVPPRVELLQGFRNFFSYKIKHGRAVNSTQAFCAVALLRHLLSSPPEPGGGRELGVEELSQALAATLKPPRHRTDSHLNFARALYRAIRKAKNYDGEILKGTTAERELGGSVFRKYVLALTQYGSSEEAADLVRGHWRTHRTSQGERLSPNGPELQPLWPMILRGLAKEGKEVPLEFLPYELLKAGLEYTPEIHEILTVFFAVRDKEEELKKWFLKPTAGNSWPTEAAYLELIRFSARQETKPPWVQEALQKLCDSNPTQTLWDVIFQWAIYQGQGDGEVKRMMGIMENLNRGESNKRPSIETINGLIRAAIEQQNPLLADRFGSLASELSLTPDSTTCALQLQVRMTGNDRIGAYAVFERMVHMKPLGPEPIETTNKYLRHLCLTPEQDGVDRILDVLSLAERRQVDLEVETVVDLCMTFMKNDLSFEVLDTLGLHAIRFSIEERQLVQDAFVEYCLSPETSTARAWDSYSLLRQFFAETNQEKRIELMHGFFRRKRADMACYVFGHMRAHPNPIVRPDIDAYVQCLEGLGEHPDLDSLRMVHNMYKMDAMIQPNTKLLNAFMIAYRACDSPSLAFEFWQDITNSAEGPTYNSLEIVLRVCQIDYFGADKAKQIWEKMERMDIEIPVDVYMAYCMAMAAHGHVVKVQELIDGMKASIEAEPGLDFLTEVYNAFPGKSLQKTFGKWVGEQYDDIWQKMKKRKWKETVEGKDQIKCEPKPLKA